MSEMHANMPTAARLREDGRKSRSREPQTDFQQLLRTEQKHKHCSSMPIKIKQKELVLMTGICSG
jgi:hypothetical protein